MNRLRKIKKVLQTKPPWINIKDLCNRRMAASIILIICAFTMIIINMIHSNTNEMLIASAFAVSFITSFLAAFRKKPDASAHIIAIAVSILMTVTVLSGGSESFSVLWILTVPALAINMLDLKSYTILNTYLLIMVITIFWTPVRTLIQENYASEFIVRFPIMYITLYLISAYMAIKNEYNLRKMQMQIYTDSLTCTFNRAYFEKMLKNYNQYDNFSITVIDINNLKTVNDTLGHQAGDELICSIPECCEDILDENSILCRTGGDEFCIISFGQSPENINDMLHKIKFKADNWSGEYCSSVHYACGTANKADYNDISCEELYKKADALMYEDKNKYYKKHKLERRKNKN